MEKLLSIQERKNSRRNSDNHKLRNNNKYIMYALGGVSTNVNANANKQTDQDGPGLLWAVLRRRSVDGVPVLGFVEECE